jgi:CheY-like chemotaxis protein
MRGSGFSDQTQGDSAADDGPSVRLRLNAAQSAVLSLCMCCCFPINCGMTILRALGTRTYVPGRRRPMSRVLLVDDNADSHDTFSSVMRHAGYPFAGALTGARSLQLAHEFTPNVAFVNVRLPDIPGPDVISVLRHQTPWLSCIAISEHFLYEYARAALRAGACDWLEKPLSREDILAAVGRALIERRRYDTSSVHLAPYEPHDVTRLAKTAVKFIGSHDDCPTLRLLGRRVGHAQGCINNWCKTAGIKARQFREFTRALRAVYRLQHEPATRETGLLEIIDDRSLKKFRIASGGSINCMPSQVEDFLGRQRFVANAELIAAVRRVLALPILWSNGVDRQDTTRRPPTMCALVRPGTPKVIGQ